jgi:hypothetical protein
MMTPSVLTLPDMEEEILLTPMGTHGLKIRMTGTTTVDEEALDLKEILLNTFKATEARLWTSWLLRFHPHFSTFSHSRDFTCH